jgi:MFS family permease
MPLFLASCVARLPMGALGLLLVLQTRDLTGSYGKGGLAAGALAVGSGVSMPMLARLIDTRGQTAVLRVGGVLCGAALVALGTVPDDVSFGVLLALSLVAGAAGPPIGACMRGLWSVLFENPERRHAAYSLEGALLEVVYISGPVAIVAGIGSWSLRAALIVCGACVVAGDIAFSLHPCSREWKPNPDRARGVLGALRSPGVRVLVASLALAGLGIGVVEVAVPAALDDSGQRDLTGLLFGFWGVGSMLAALTVGRSGPKGSPRRRLGIPLALWGVTHAVVGLGGSPLAIGVLLFLAGVSIAPTFIAANGLLDGAAVPGTLTEAFTWLTTGMTAGVALGNAAGGALTEAASPAIATLLLGSGGLAAARFVALALPGAPRAQESAAPA